MGYITGLYGDNGKGNGNYHIMEFGSSAATLNSKWGFPRIRGNFLGGTHNKDYSILRSILGSPYFGKLPNPKPQTLDRNCMPVRELKHLRAVAKMRRKARLRCAHFVYTGFCQIATENLVSTACTCVGCISAESRDDPGGGQGGKAGGGKEGLTPPGGKGLQHLQGQVNCGVLARKWRENMRSIWMALAPDLPYTVLISSCSLS